jgi:glutamate-1-semialdehyde 2,1-aminomutase
MTFGAFGGRADLMATFDPRRPGHLAHAGTFNNNVLSMAAGYAGLTEVFTPAVSKELYDRGERLRTRLNAIDAPLCWTGMGSMLTVHFGHGPVTSPRDLVSTPAQRELFHLEMFDRGFHLARRGMIALSLEIGDRECDDFCAAVTEFAATHLT